MLTYNQIDPKKKAFIFELDNVLFPERDYHLQVYYLFAHIIEYLETTPSGNDLTEFMKSVYLHHGPEKVFDRAREAFGLEEKYRQNFEQLMQFIMQYGEQALKAIEQMMNDPDKQEQSEMLEQLLKEKGVALAAAA